MSNPPITPETPTLAEEAVADSASEATEERYPESLKEVAAIYSNTYYVSVTEDSVRLTFGENLEGDVRYRSAVSLPIWVAENLVETMDMLLGRKREKATETDG